MGIIQMYQMFYEFSYLSYKNKKGFCKNNMSKCFIRV